MKVQDYKNAAKELKQFNSEMVDLRIKAKNASIEDIIYLIQRDSKDSKKTALALAIIKSSQQIIDAFKSMQEAIVKNKPKPKFPLGGIATNKSELAYLTKCEKVMNNR